MFSIECDSCLQDEVNVHNVINAIYNVHNEQDDVYIICVIRQHKQKCVERKL